MCRSIIGPFSCVFCALRYKRDGGTPWLYSRSLAFISLSKTERIIRILFEDADLLGASSKPNEIKPSSELFEIEPLFRGFSFWSSIHKTHAVSKTTSLFASSNILGVFQFIFLKQWRRSLFYWFLLFLFLFLFLPQPAPKLPSTSRGGFLVPSEKATFIPFIFPPQVLSKSVISCANLIVF